MKKLFFDPLFAALQKRDFLWQIYKEKELLRKSLYFFVFWLFIISFSLSAFAIYSFSNFLHNLNSAWGNEVFNIQNGEIISQKPLSYEIADNFILLMAKNDDFTEQELAIKKNNHNLSVFIFPKKTEIYLYGQKADSKYQLQDIMISKEESIKGKEIINEIKNIRVSIFIMILFSFLLGATVSFFINGIFWVILFRFISILMAKKALSFTAFFSVFLYLFPIIIAVMIIFFILEISINYAFILVLLPIFLINILELKNKK